MTESVYDVGTSLHSKIVLKFDVIIDDSFTAIEAVIIFEVAVLELITCAPEEVSCIRNFHSRLYSGDSDVISEFV